MQQQPNDSEQRKQMKLLLILRKHNDIQAQINDIVYVRPERERKVRFTIQIRDDEFKKK